MRFARRSAGSAITALLLLTALCTPARAAEPNQLMAPCLVTYTVDPIWVNGFTASVAVTNRGINPPNGQVAMSLPANEAAQVVWDAILTVGNPQHPVLTLPAYHPNVVIGETYTFGFNGTYAGVYDHAYAFRLAGTLCDVIYN